MNRKLYDFYIVERRHRADRKTVPEMAEGFAAGKLPLKERMVRRFEALCAAEEARFEPFEKIVFRRTVANLPDILTKEEREAMTPNFHETGYVSNLSPDYEKTIREGLLARFEEADDEGKRVITALLGLCDKYLDAAKAAGREDLVKVFSRVPRYGARNFREALQFFRILHFALWLEGDYHNTVGRFDRYMYPYYYADLCHGTYDKSTALSLLEDFFLSFNKDSDLYFGQQQGDNGQSMMLGGADEDGNDVFNDLSELCLQASEELKVIDPKINLRVSKDTPLSRYEAATRLTRAGLGFPQYSNDDVVIPGLCRLGYDLRDARNYTVAACWEFIIPGVGDDVANVAPLNLPLAVDRAIRKILPAGGDFEALKAQVKIEISRLADEIEKDRAKIVFLPSPFLDLLRDGRKYRNFGVHGVGIASAVDALSAVKKTVFDEKKVSPERLIRGLDEDFENDPELLHLLRYETPKMGMADAGCDALAGFVLESFAEALKGRKNCFGGIYRAGTGTAMFYLRSAAKEIIGATADGRRRGEPFGTNFSPNLFTEVPGPVSCIDSFTANDMQDTINGGPLTLEFASSIFKDGESITKIAELVRYFILRGGHQLQLNAVNPEAMRAAQKNPDAYRNLVVRIWGWSAYFVELDREFQDHVIARQEYVV